MSGLWATATAGWITIAAFTISLIATIFAWGKWTQRTNSLKGEFNEGLTQHKEQIKNQLDGFGNRVTSLERGQTNLQGEFNGANNDIQRLLGQHDALMKLIGEARGSTIQCREDTFALGEKIERKMDGLSGQLSETTLQLSQRMAGVERELEIMRRES
jgi:peptidoglycan hydrolase CwlO-like protein